jgi:hypothetical protein
MHTQQIKFSAYFAWGVGMGGVVAVLVFEEGKVSGMNEVDDDVDGLVLDVVVVVVCGLPSASFFKFLVVLLLDFICTV